MAQVVENGTATSKRKTSTRKTKKVKYTKEQYIEWFTLMFRIRKFEEKALQMYGAQKIRGFCHVYIGQEAIAAGLESALIDGDSIVTAYRQHGIALGRGVTMNAAMAELYGKETGIVKGKGGSMHFFDKPNNYFGGNGIVGAQIPIGTGIAFAEMYKGTNNLCVTMFGDGASRQGALHESFNMAMAWNIPVLYIVENNGYAMGTSVSRTSNVVELHQLGASYSMPSESVDGMDPAAVHEAIGRASAHIRAGKGPYFLEIKTYRYKGHSVSDPAKYRTKEEVKQYKDIDPIKTSEKILLTTYKVKPEEIKDIKNAVNAEVAASVKFAEESNFPDPSELYTDNYTQENYPFLE
ncbi:MAG: pyruvate dehydrogenase (acetyl-transferring) E1 component subunit alpha [Saprospiraceae bacterium]